jgi:hypothetical protein
MACHDERRSVDRGPILPLPLGEGGEGLRKDGVKIGTIKLYATNDRFALDREMAEAVANYWSAVGLDVGLIAQSRNLLFPQAQGLKQEQPSLTAMAIGSDCQIGPSRSGYRSATIPGTGACNMPPALMRGMKRSPGSKSPLWMIPGV